MLHFAPGQCAWVGGLVMRRTAILLTIVLASGTVAAGAGAATARAAVAKVSVDPSTNLSSEQYVDVTATGFTPDVQLASAECITGATTTNDCDLGSTFFGTSDASGGATFRLRVRAEIVIDAGPVDCTVAGACAVSVGEFFDLAGTAVSAPISFAPVGPPEGGVLHTPEAPVATFTGIDVKGTSFTPNALIYTDECAAGATSPQDCDIPFPVVANNAGTWHFNMSVPDFLETLGGEIDCKVHGACVFAAWDVRDFAGTLSTAPINIAPEVAGTLAVSPSSGLHDGDQVTVSGSGWPAELYINLYQCQSPAFDARCGNYANVQTDDDGSFTTQFTVHSVFDQFDQHIDCESGPCYINASWWPEGAVVAVTKKITFDVKLTPVMSHYTAAEKTAVDGAAATLGVSEAEVQRLGSWGLAWVLALTGTGTITPVANSGPGTITTSWTPSQYSALRTFAAAHGTTVAEFQKTGAIFLAFVLTLADR